MLLVYFCYNKHMDVIHSVILGLTQGLTEFIPVSSSGHLEIIQEILGGRTSDFHLFIEFINFGTLAALLFFYRKRICEICVDIFKKHNYKLFFNLVITSIPAVIAALLLKKLIENAPFFSSLITIMCAMGIVGILMIIIDKLPHMSKLKDENSLTPLRALYIGLAQTFALIPGVSRSGSTIVAGRLVGLNSRAAADYSFLASIPIMCGVVLMSFISSDSRAYMAANWGTLLLSNVIAFASGMVAINFVLKYLRKKESLQAFGWYRVVMAIIILIFVLLA